MSAFQPDENHALFAGLLSNIWAYAGACCLLLARFHLHIKVGFFPHIALGGTGLHLRLGLVDRSQAFFVPRAFLRDIQALGQRFLIGGVGACEQFLDLGLGLRLDLLLVPVGQRAADIEELYGSPASPRAFYGNAKVRA